MKHMFSLVVLTLMFCSVFAITWESAPHPIGNTAISFAGEPAMQAVGDTIYIAYLAAVDDVSSCLYFAKSSAGNTYTTQVSSYMCDLLTVDSGAPSLVLDLPNIAILVKKGGYLYSFYSNDFGNEWNEQEPHWHTFAANDPYPLMSLTETGIRYFTVKSQAELAGYALFTDSMETTNGTSVYFGGNDVITGPVRTNSDLRIKQVGGGDNGGWPTFLAPVITAGHVVSVPANYPLDQVFRGGLIEEADVSWNYMYSFGQDFISEALLIGPAENWNHIVLLEVDGNTASGYLGTYSLPRRVHATVYDNYPPAGDSLFSNAFTVVDTIWTPIAPFQMPDKLYTRGDLWLKGTFSGQKSIYSESNIYLIGDILLSGTPVGESPLTNPTDKVSLLSAKQIIVKYGYKNPADSLRIHPNLGADSDYPAPAGGGIFIYADLIAMNHENGGYTFQDGTFTFEYQHPHPSTPALNVEITNPDGTQETEIFDWIDIHRRRYFPTYSQPWPSPALEQTRLDLPYYNPLWPESQPYLERGTVNLWGSLYEKRRGFMHRSHNDNEYPSNAGVWDIYIDKCGYPTDPVLIMDPVLGDIGLMSRNYPGAAGSGVGYKRNHQYDPRIFADIPKMNILGMGAKISESIGFDYPSLVVKWHKLNEPVIHKSMDQINGQFLYHLNNILFTDEEAYPQNLPDGWEIIQAKLLANGNVLILEKDSTDIHQPCRLVISDLQGNGYLIHGSPYIQDFISLHRILDGFIFVIPGDSQNTATLIRLDENGNFVSDNDILPLPADFASDSLLDSRIVLNSPQPGILHAVLWAKTSSLGSPLWHLQGTIAPISTDDPVVVPSALSLNCYPNPFTERISLEVKSPTSQQLRINIYNVKGQKVKTLQLYVQSGSGQITWNGNDDKGQPVAQGIYFARIAGAEYSKITKILRIK
ncbi:MAG: T9SS type A sorting domain-containing protein [Candidatus Cloacimonetes bacterium]|nr:T9SS type A sorting domain-containing protein [Candidatus Cloacimonadota bacterium]MCB5287789.1 T9SS type A sorting domain-containing protein [Candidatus Cloacimonadota bacterium]MCK9183790.1 T9SS type A sorting domain-containing protein [Candidatus Cloacimonadota bacterium]MDY0230110.1 FlgD immunoglobulin-like domain containing protein [Candidatus Cloacimonadaceae bacterium]